VFLSPSNRYLWAAARLRTKDKGPGPSYVSCFLLDDKGLIVKRMFMIPITSAGAPVEVTPVPWSDEFVAVSNYPVGEVQMLRMQGRKETTNGVEYDTALTVAGIKIDKLGCCGSHLWYN
jgi:hypothetical protein